MAINYSIVIPTYNRLSWLTQCLQAIVRQAESMEIEMIFLDDGSSDGTPDFLAAMEKQYPFIKAIYQRGEGPARLRNMGAALSQGRFLCFLDDDSIIEPGWFEALHASAQKLEPPYVAIKGYVRPYQDTPMALFLGEHIHISDSWATNNIAFDRERFREAGGFDEQFTFAAWEDLDLGFRLERMGYRRFYNPDMQIRHPHEDSIEKLKRKFKINGYGFFQFCRKWMHIDRGWIIRMWIERLRVLYYLLPGMQYVDYLRYIHGLRLRYEIYALVRGLLTGGAFTRSTKD